MTTVPGLNNQLPPPVAAKPTFVHFKKGLYLNISSYHHLVDTLAPVAQCVIHSISADLGLTAAEQVQVLESVYRQFWEQKDKIDTEGDNIVAFSNVLNNVLIDFLSELGALDKLERLYKKWKWEKMFDHDPARLLVISQ